MSVNYISYGLYILYADDSLEAALIINYLSLEVVKSKVSFKQFKSKVCKNLKGLSVEKVDKRSLVWSITPNNAGLSH